LQTFQKYRIDVLMNFRREDVVEFLTMKNVALDLRKKNAQKLKYCDSELPTEQPTTEQPTTEQPTTEPPTTEKPTDPTECNSLIRVDVSVVK